MNNIKSFEDFRQDGSKPVNESIPFGSYYYNDRTSFGEHADNLPEKGETKYLVFAHNSADLNGQTIRLEGEVRFGSTTSKRYIGIFEDEASATDAYNTSMKKPEGTFVSFSMGTLYAKSKFSFQYEETQGKLAKIKVR